MRSGVLILNNFFLVRFDLNKCFSYGCWWWIIISKLLFFFKLNWLSVLGIDLLVGIFNIWLGIFEKLSDCFFVVILFVLLVVLMNKIFVFDFCVIGIMGSSVLMWFVFLFMFIIIFCKLVNLYLLGMVISGMEVLFIKKVVVFFMVIFFKVLSFLVLVIIKLKLCFFRKERI